MTTPPAEEQVNIQGPASETLFHRARTWALTAGKAAELQTSLDSLLGHVASLADDRLLALLGALVLENAVDRLAGGILPGYEDIRNNSDFSFSMRTAIARSLRLAPQRLFTSVDAVRAVRNDFAHNLDLKLFSDLKPGRMVAIKDRLREFGPHFLKDRTDYQIFQQLVSLCAMALMIYTKHVEVLSKAVRDPAFLDILRTYVERGHWPPNSAA
jgi:hypothetical protein